MGTVHQNFKKIVGIKIENSVKENQWFLGDCVNIAVVTPFYWNVGENTHLWFYNESLEYYAVMFYSVQAYWAIGELFHLFEQPASGES